MANSDATKEKIYIKTNKKYKYALKPCHVSLTKIDDEAHLNNIKQSSQDLKQSIAIPCIENKVHSKTPKIKSCTIHKSNKTSRDFEKSVSTMSAQHNHNVSASSSVVTDCHHKPCCVALERLAIPINHLSVYSSEREDRIKNFAIYNSSKYTNCENISSNADCLIHKTLDKYHSQPDNVEVDCNYKKIQKCSFEMKMPCQPNFNSSYQLSEDNTEGSFISDSKLSTPISLIQSEEIQKTEESNNFLPGISSVSTKGIVKENNTLLTSTPVKRRISSPPTKKRRISFSGSDVSKLDAGKDTETLDCNQNIVKTNESLSPDHCASKEVKESDDLKRCMKRNTKLLSSSSESSTVRNQYSFKSRKDVFFQGKHKKYRKCKRDLPYPDSNSSDFSKLDAGKDTETLDYNQNSVKTNESLSPDHCASKEVKESDDLKRCMKRNTKLLSSSSESSTVRNQYSFKSRKDVFFQGKHKKHRKCKRDLPYPDSNSSDFSKLDAGKDTETLDYNQNSVKTNESLSPDHCASKEVKESDDLKHCMKRNTKLLSSSSESSTVRNQYSFKSRKDVFFQGKHKKHRKCKRDLPYPDSNSSDFSKLDAGKDTETLDYNQNSVKTNESLSPDHCASKEVKESDDLKHCMKRNTKLLSSSSGSSTVRNQYSFKSRKDAFFQEKHKKHRKHHCASKEVKESGDLKRCMKRNTKVLSSSSESSTVRNQSSFRGRKGAFFQGRHKKHRKCKKDLPYPDSDSSGDSDSTVFNSSIATASSYKQTLMKQKIELTAASSSNSSETGEIFFDNSLSDANKKMLKHKQSKHSFKVKHIKTKRVHVSNTSREHLNKCVSSEKSAASNIPSNSERGHECNRSFKYDLKPCSVLLVDTGKNNVISNTGNQCNDLHQKDSPKATCLKLNSSKQIHLSKRTEESKSMKCIEKENFDNNKDFITEKEYIVHTDSDDLPEYEKSHIKKCSDYVDTNSVHDSQDHNSESHHKTLNKQIEELECYFSDSSNSLLNLDTVFDNSEFLKKAMKWDFKDSSENASMKRVHVSNTSREHINNCVSSEKSAASDIPSNSERGQECNRSFKYDLKPCCVLLVDTRKNNVISNTGHQCNDLHQKDSPKATCLELNSSKQIHLSERTEESKSMKYIEKENFDNNKDFITEKECIVLTDSDDLPEYEKSHIKKCSDYVDTNSVHDSQDHNSESHHKTLNKQIKEHGCYFSDSSNSLPNLDTVFADSEFLKKTMKCDSKDSSENDSSAENSKKILNYKELNSVISSKKCSSVNKENDKLKVTVICDDPDMDESYLADTDEGSDNLQSALKNYNSVLADNCKPSADLSVNQSRSEIDDKNTSKKIPYCYLGPKKKCAKNNGRFLFRSKTNGSEYIVDYFEYQNIEKLFVTIHWKKDTLLYSNNDSNRNSSKTLSERIEALGGFNRMDANICPRIHATSGKNQHENKQKYPGKENLSLFDKGEVLSTKENSESLNTDYIKSDPNCSRASLSDDTTLSNTSSDHSDNNKYDNFCVHCCAKFSSKRESYNHTCDGKLQKGYLCVYCEMIFSSYSKLQSHRALHFI